MREFYRLCIQVGVLFVLLLRYNDSGEVILTHVTLTPSNTHVKDADHAAVILCGRKITAGLSASKYWRPVLQFTTKMHAETHL